MAAYTADLIPTMSSNTAPSGEAGTNSFYNDDDTYAAWRGFNKNTADYWFSKANELPVYLAYDFGVGVTKTITKYTILPFQDIQRQYDPYTWTFQGSNNAVAWDTLDTQTAYSFTGQAKSSFPISNTTAYRYYKLLITVVFGQGLGNQYAIIAEMEMMETKPVTTNYLKNFRNDRLSWQ